MAVTLIGIVVNPKMKKPVLVSWDGDEVEVFRTDAGKKKPIQERSIQELTYQERQARAKQRRLEGLRRRNPTARVSTELAFEGRGSFQTEPYGEYDVPAQATGYPRVHTPSGVKTPGKGYGTTLYTGLCLAAHEDDDNEISIDATVEGDGISSSEATRSASANAWWNRAKRLGLASSMDAETSEEHVDLTDRGVDAHDLDRCGLVERGTITYINDLSVDLETYVEADAFPYRNAEQASLVVSSFTMAITKVDEAHLRDFWRELVENDFHEVHDVDEAALLALDVRGITPQTMNLLTALARSVDIDDHDIDAMRLRWQFGLDPSTPIKQQRLPFISNPDESHAVEYALESAVDFRKEVGWERLASLP